MLTDEEQSTPVLPDGLPSEQAEVVEQSSNQQSQLQSLSEDEGVELLQVFGGLQRDWNKGALRNCSAEEVSPH